MIPEEENKVESPEIVCNICLMKITESEVKKMDGLCVLKCNHIFHEACLKIIKYKLGACPLVECN